MATPLTDFAPAKTGLGYQSQTRYQIGHPPYADSFLWLCSPVLLVSVRSNRVARYILL